MSEKNNVRPFGFKDKIGYMFGDFGNDFTFILSSSFMLKFYTDVMGIHAAVVGVLMMAARFVDAFTDVAMGQIVDRSKPTKDGKFKPWLRRMCGPVAISSFLVFQSGFANMPYLFKVVWMIVTYILWGSIFYTSINIPYGSMASAISADAKDRASLSTWRSIGSTLAGLVIGVGTPLFAYETVNGNTILSGNRMTIIAAAILLLLVMLTMQGMNAYLFPNFYGNVAAQSVAALAGSLVMLVVCAPLATKLSAKYGKKELAIGSCLFGAVVYLICWVLKPENPYTYVVFYVVANIGVGFFNMVIWAMITDVIDDAEVKNGVREDGTIYSVYSFARKIGQALSSGMIGALLSVIGYSAATAFNPEVVNGIFNMTCIIPAIGFVGIALVLMFLYPLSKNRVEANVLELKKRRGEI